MSLILEMNTLCGDLSPTFLNRMSVKCLSPMVRNADTVKTGDNYI